jgi:hypothetical protein
MFLLWEFWQGSPDVHRIKDKMDSESKIQVSLSLNLNVGC